MPSKPKDGRPGDDGLDGESAYQIARRHGCKLTEKEWLASLKGQPGDSIKGDKGDKGEPGESIKGDTGDAGQDGLSAFEIAKRAGFQGGMQDWLKSLKGDSGPPGKSVRGPEGKAGERGPSGFNGWTPILAVVEDGERRIHQVVGWAEAEGFPPESGMYLGDEGFVDRKEDATDLRGTSGPPGTITGRRTVMTGGPGPQGPQGPPGVFSLNIRTTAVDTTATDDDDIIICTAELTVTLPDGSGRTKPLKIKRSGMDDVTVVPFGGQTIEQETERILNVNLWALELFYDGVSNWVEL